MYPGSPWIHSVVTSSLPQVDIPIYMPKETPLRWGCALKVGSHSAFDHYYFLLELTLLLGVQVFHAGTERTNTGELKTAGGRVFAVAAYGSRLDEAVSLA